MLAEDPGALCVFIVTYLQKGPAVFKTNLFYWQLRFKLSALQKWPVWVNQKLKITTDETSVQNGAKAVNGPDWIWFILARHS